jgi:hydroxyacylglutathione hydrolase
MTSFSLITVGMFEVNCYLVPVAKSRRLYIIDPGDDAESVVAAAAEFDYDEAVILLTHTHVDHIRGVPGVYEKLGVKHVMVHPDDQEFYHSPYNQLLPYLPAAENLPECIGEIPKPDFEVIHTPGHTPGCVCYRFDNALFCGDTLFAGSIGRTDLPGGNSKTLLKSIKSELMILPEELKTYPGHGPATTIGEEKKHNPFIN